jgi:hypothetical protein
MGEGGGGGFRAPDPPCWAHPCLIPPSSLDSKIYTVTMNDRNSHLEQRSICCGVGGGGDCAFFILRSANMLPQQSVCYPGSDVSEFHPVKT